MKPKMGEDGALCFVLMKRFLLSANRTVDGTLFFSVEGDNFSYRDKVCQMVWETCIRAKMAICLVMRGWAVASNKWYLVCRSSYSVHNYSAYCMHGQVAVPWHDACVGAV